MSPNSTRSHPAAIHLRWPRNPEPPRRQLWHRHRNGRWMDFRLKIRSLRPPAHRTPDRTVPVTTDSGERRGPLQPVRNARKRCAATPGDAGGDTRRTDPGLRTAGRGRWDPARSSAVGSWCRDSILAVDTSVCRTVAYMSVRTTSRVPGNRSMQSAPWGSRLLPFRSSTVCVRRRIPALLRRNGPGPERSATSLRGRFALPEITFARLTRPPIPLDLTGRREPASLL